METIRKLRGANMDLDLTSSDMVSWSQDKCPWNEEQATTEHKCAVKNTSICQFFCGVEYADTLLCCYPYGNPQEEK